MINANILEAARKQSNEFVPGQHLYEKQF